MKFISLYNIIIESRLDDYKLQLKDQLLANSIFSLNNPKKQKMIIKWIKNGSIQYPQQKQLIDKVYQIINRKQLDYQTIKDPHILLNQYQQLDQKINYNPDNQKCFTNKVQLGNGVVVYNVQNDFKGLKAVRRAVDYNWGEDAKPWCLITPPLKTKAFRYWKKYSYIPKRICFQNGKLIAFCANNDFVIQWWDRNDKPHKNIPIEGVEDDPNALKEIQQFKQAKQDSKTSNNPKRLQQIYQKYKNDEQIKLNLAKNPNCSSNILQKLSNDIDKFVRIIVAINKNTPISILQKLSKHESIVAINPNCPINILQKLSNDNDKYVRRNVAKNPNCSSQLLQKLSQDEDYDVRECVAINKNTPIKILQKLSQDKYDFVRKKAIQNLNKY